ncbi:MAG: TonB-dependent receptor [Myxococcales bacterium]
MAWALVVFVVLAEVPTSGAPLVTADEPVAGPSAPAAATPTPATPTDSPPAQPPAVAEPTPDDYQQLADELGLLERITQTPVEVGAVGTGDDLFKTPSNVSIIDRAAIETYGFRTVSEALTTLAGVSVMRTYLKRNLPTVRGVVQDLYADKVLVLVDGVPSWHAVTGEGNLDRVDLRDVDRIEVLKGPGSVVYGTNAYSGAINLVLRHPEAGTRGEARAELGSLRHLGAGGSFGHGEEKLKVFAAANVWDERGQLKGFTDESGLYGLVPQYMKVANGTLRASYSGLGGEHSLLLNGYAVHESTLGVTPLYSQGAGRDHFLEGWLANYQFEHRIGEEGGVRAAASFDWNHRDFPRTGDDSERANVVGYRLEGLVQGHYSPTKWLEIQAGADLDYRYALAYSNYRTLTREVITTNNMSGQNVLEGSVLGQLRLSSSPLWTGMPLELLVGVRYTNNAHFGDNVSARGTLAWAFSEHSSVKLVAAQSFRAPTLFEMSFQTPNLTVRGNEDLKPETSNSIRAGLAGRLPEALRPRRGLLRHLRRQDLPRPLRAQRPQGQVARLRQRQERLQGLGRRGGGPLRGPGRRQRLRQLRLRARLRRRPGAGHRPLQLQVRRRAHRGVRAGAGHRSGHSLDGGPPHLHPGRAAAVASAGGDLGRLARAEAGADHPHTPRREHPRQRCHGSRVRAAQPERAAVWGRPADHLHLRLVALAVPRASPPAPLSGFAERGNSDLRP